MNYKKINQLPNVPERTHVPLMNPSIVTRSFNLGYNSAVYPHVVGKYPTENTAYHVQDIQNCGYQFIERKCS